MKRDNNKRILNKTDKELNSLRSYLFIITVLSITFNPLSAAHAAPVKLFETDEITIYVPGDKWCGHRLWISVYAKDEAIFKGERTLLKQELKKFQNQLKVTCPHASSFDIKGWVNKHYAFQGYLQDFEKRPEITGYNKSPPRKKIETGRKKYGFGKRKIVKPKPLSGLSQRPVKVGMPPRTFEYHDITMWSKGKVESSIGVEPIDDLFQSMRDQGFKKCLAYRKIKLSSGGDKSFSVKLRHFGTKRYAIHCSGGCKGLTYEVKGRGILYHFGKSMPFPVVQLKSMTLGYGSIQFGFRKVEQTSAIITVMQWSGGFGDYGGGCKQLFNE